MANIIEIEELEYFYPDGTQALKGINLEIEEGKKIVVLGVNGSGKSTLFLNINGVLNPSKGKIKFRGEEIKRDKKFLNFLRAKIGIVFQNPETMLFSSNVFQEVSFGPMNLGMPNEKVIENVEKALKNVDMYAEKDKSIHFLSYGQKKRVSIADIIAMDSELIIFDEPTSSLDPKHTKELTEILNRLNAEKKTIIVATHDVNFAYSWADEIIILNDGKIAFKDRVEKAFLDEELIKKCYLEKPYILKFFEILKEKELLKSEIELPRDIEKLKSVIK